MKTIKRVIPSIDTSIANTNKYFNQLEFKGIVKDKNIFNLDQESFSDALNVYVNGDGQFVSRESLQKDISIPKDPAIYFGYELVDYKTIGKFKLLVRKAPDNTYVILLYNENNEYYELNKITKYNIALIEHYIICFNDSEKGAQLFDTNEPGWTNLTDYAEIPVIKRVVGSQTTMYDKNEFTEAYKEEYIWSNQSRPILPEANKADETAIVLNTSSRKYEWEISDIELNTDYRILRQIDFIPLATDIITIEQDRICIARDSYFLISFNGGISFTTVYYPEFGGTFLKIASISKDGQYFFFVTTTGVYKCYLGDFKWDTAIVLDNNEQIKGEQLYNSCNFLTGDIFCFITKETIEYGDSIRDKLYVYCKGPGIYPGTDPTITGKLVELSDLIDNNDRILISNRNIANSIVQDIYRTSIVIQVINNITLIGISIPLIDNLPEKTVFRSQVYYVYGDDSSKYFKDGYEEDLKKSLLFTSIDHNNSFDNNFNDNLKFIILQNISLADPLDKLTMGITMSCLTQDQSNNWYNSNLTLGIDIEGPNSWVVVVNWNKGDFININNPSIAFKLDGGYLVEYNTYSYISNSWKVLPEKLDNSNFINLISSANKKSTWVNGDYFYIQASNNIIYTNRLLDNDIASITYTYNKTEPFKLVPNISYSDTELYLAFGDKLKITENSRNINDNTRISFNLPAKNNQSFIDNITAMVNISTTDVAIFFKDKIVLCSKVEDENLGYRYDYYNTKLSLGVRLGDSVINTLEGSYTIFPTIRGLAIMNYQAFMATTDQIVEYITDEIKEIWDKFYEASNIIKIIQHKGHLILTNNTKDILLYNISRKTWWKWEIPYNVLNTLSDQIDLRLITRGELCIFTDTYIVNNEVKKLKYYDFSAHGENNTINWKVISQPLHLKAINYYKNLKELIFQLFTDNTEKEINTINAQIKLYRKNITVREPATIQFTIEQLRTFVKRFNYWKINEVQWGLANDTNTSAPAKLKLNGISIKYELGDEVH